MIDDDNAPAEWQDYVLWYWPYALAAVVALLLWAFWGDLGRVVGRLM